MYATILMPVWSVVLRKCQVLLLWWARTFSSSFSQFFLSLNMLTDAHINQGFVFLRFNNSFSKKLHSCSNENVHWLVVLSWLKKQEDENNVFFQINQLKPSQVLIDYYLLCQIWWGEPSKKSFIANLFKLTYSCSLIIWTWPLRWSSHKMSSQAYRRCKGGWCVEHLMNHSGTQSNLLLKIGCK